MCHTGKKALFLSLRQNCPWNQNKQGQYVCTAAQLHLCWELEPVQRWGCATGNWYVNNWAKDCLFSNRKVGLDAYKTLQNLAVIW